VQARILGWDSAGDSEWGLTRADLPTFTTVTGPLVVNPVPALGYTQYVVDGRNVDPATIVPVLVASGAVAALAEAVEELANPYHGPDGRFTGPGGGRAVPTKGYTPKEPAAPAAPAPKAAGGAAKGPLPQSTTAEHDAALDSAQAWQLRPNGQPKRDPELRKEFGADAKAHDSYVKRGHMQTNGALRGQRPMDARTEQNVAGMDSMFGKAGHTLDEPLTVRREVDPKTFDAVFSGMKPGTVFKDDGFVSTAAVGKNADLVMASTAGTTPSRISIRLPGGTRVLAGDREERELILPRGSQFRVHRVSGRDLEVELIP
jgi:hypothetical protein